jgi:hypothetical protein
LKPIKSILLLSSFLLATSTVTADEQALFGRLLKGQGETRVAAVSDLFGRTEQLEAELLSDCEKAFGHPSWSEITYAVSNVPPHIVHAYQDFLCLASTQEAAARSVGRKSEELN